MEEKRYETTNDQNILRRKVKAQSDMTNYKIQVEKLLSAGDIFGEIGVLCNIPQPFTFRTSRVSQLLRVHTTVLKNILLENKNDKEIIMNNLYQVNSQFLSLWHHVLIISCLFRKKNKILVHSAEYELGSKVPY